MWLLESCYHATIRAVFMDCIDICLERKGRGGCEGIQALRVCLVEATR